MTLTRTQKIFLVLFFVLIFLYCFNQINSPDSFYDVKTGQLIWQTWQIPHNDVFSFTAFGAVWIPHEWLAQLIFYGVQNAFGFWGLMAFVAALATTTFFLLFKIARKKGANFYVTLATLFVVGAASFQFWIPRPEIFTFLLCVAMIYFLEEYQATRKIQYLLLAVAAVWLWANMNASVALGLLIFAAFCVTVFLRDRKWSPQIKYFILAFFAALALAFVNPSTYQIFTYGIIILPAIRALHIDEWIPLLGYWLGWDTKLFVFEIAAATFFLVWRLGIKKERRDLAWLAIIAGAAIMPFIASRYLAWWAVLAAAPLAWTISDLIKNSRRQTSPRILFVIGIIACVGLLIFRWFTLPNYYVDTTTLPVYAPDFLADNNAQGNIFNMYDQGGYLLWRLWPNMKIFIDGRSEVFLGEPIADYYSILQDKPIANYLINQKYNIQFFVLPYDPTLFSQIRPLLLSLNDADWQLVWWDDGAIVFAKDDAQNQAIINQYALRYISPFIDPTTISSKNAPFAAAEMQTLMERVPNSAILKAYVTSFLESR